MSRIRRKPCTVLGMYVFNVLEQSEKSYRVNRRFLLSVAQGWKFEYEKSPVGLFTLNKIMPNKLCKKVGLPRKTAHCCG